MKKNSLKIVKALLFLSLGLILIWLVTKNLTPEDKSNIYAAFKKADYFWIVIAMLISALSHWSRAIRWKMLLEAMGHKPKISNTFFAVMIGYLANFALPRLGEVSRCGVLTKYENIPFSESFGTVITERAFDVICLLLIFVLTLLMEFNKIYELVNINIIHPLHLKMLAFAGNTWLFLTLLLVLSIIAVLLFKYKLKIKALFSQKLVGILLGFWEGIKSVKNVKSPLAFIAHTVFIWSMYTLIVYVMFYSFSETAGLGVGTAFSIVAFGSVAIIFVPGGTGAYQALITQLLTVSYFISFPIAFAFSWIVWTLSLIVILILGLLSLVLLPIVNKEKL